MTSASVIVCTHTERRWDILEASVRAAHAQLRPGDSLIVVVDHAPELLTRARTALTGDAVTVVPNRRTRGLSGARNTGVEATSGEIVIFLDDDAVPRTGWLDAMVAPLTDAAVDGVGGVAAPAWPHGSSRPDCLPRASGQTHGELDWVVGCSFPGQAAPDLRLRNPMGCSMALRRDAIEAAGGFHEDLGRIGSTPLGCEETELAIRIGARRPGTHMRLAPDAIVDHHQTSERLTWRYLWARCFAEGVSKAAVSRMAGTRSSLSSETTYVRRVIPAAMAREVGQIRRAPRASMSAAVALTGAVGVTAAGYARGRLGRHAPVTAAPILASARQPGATA